jgi:hypothetical protein
MNDLALSRNLCLEILEQKQGPEGVHFILVHSKQRPSSAAALRQKIASDTDRRLLAVRARELAKE